MQVDGGRINDRLTPTRVDRTVITAWTEAIDRCDDAGKLKTLCQHLTEAIGYDCFLAAYVFPMRRNFVVSTYPEDWLKVYDKRKFLRIDPVVTHGMNAFSGYDWSEIPLTAEAAPLFQAATKHGICGGFSVPARGPDGNSCLLCFASARPMRLAGEVRTELLRDMQYVAACCLEAGARILEAAGLHAVSGERFTVRQIECLRLVSRGKTVKEIGRVMGISPGRVTQLLDIVQKKMGVESREEMLCAATIKGITGWDFIPKRLAPLEEPGKIDE